MPLGTDVGLVLRDVVFETSMWTQLLPEKGHTHPQPIFGQCLFWSNGWMDEDVAWYGNDLGPGCIVLDGFPAPAKVAQQTPSFRLMSIVATVAHLS